MRLLAALILFPVVLFGATESVSVDTKTKKVQNPLVKFGSGNTLDCTGATVTNCGSGSGVAWGAITGTLSNQTDLQSALNAKGSGTVTSIATTSPITGGTITGTGTLGLNVGVDHAFTTNQTITVTSSSAVVDGLNLVHNDNLGGAPGTGIALLLELQDSTTPNEPAARISSVWSDATHSTRTSYLDFALTLSGSTASKARLFADGLLSVNDTTDLGVPGIHARFIPVANAVTSATSWTPASNTYDQEAQTAIAGDLTVNAPSGTPSDGKHLIMRIKNNGTPHNITWNGAYNPIGITLPATIGASKTIYTGVIWNSNTSKWDALVTSGD